MSISLKGDEVRSPIDEHVRVRSMFEIMMFDEIVYDTSLQPISSFVQVHLFLETSNSFGFELFSGLCQVLL